MMMMMMDTLCVWRNSELKLYRCHECFSTYLSAPKAQWRPGNKWWWWTTNTNQSEWTDSLYQVISKAQFALTFLDITCFGGVALGLTNVHINENRLACFYLSYVWICVVSPLVSCDWCLCRFQSPAFIWLFFFLALVFVCFGMKFHPCTECMFLVFP